MIYSKGNMLCVEITKNDKDIPVLDNVHFTKEGGSIASGGEPACVLAVSPVMDKTKESVPLSESEMTKDITINSASVKEVIKNIPKDTKYGGALEHVDLDIGKEIQGEGEINFIVSSDKGRLKSFEAKEFPFEYVDYKEVFKQTFSRDRQAKTAINLKRFITMLQSIDKICPDSTKHSILYMEFTDKNDIILRAKNNRNDQNVIGIMKAYSNVEGKEMELTKWERKLVCKKKILIKKKKILRK